MKKQSNKLAVLSVGLGAVATTVMAGVIAVGRGWAKPIGSLSQFLYRDKINLTPLTDIEFGAWDIFADNAYESAKTAQVLDKDLLQKCKGPLQKIKPFPGLFNKRFLRALKAKHCLKTTSAFEQFKTLRTQIRRFMTSKKCERAVVVLAHSTELSSSARPSWATWSQVEKALRKNDRRISPTMIYTWAALWEGCSVVNATPNQWGPLEVLNEIAERTGACFSGSDLKTGQTLMKSIIAPGLKARLLGVKGWFSSNILGNRDGQVLDDPGAFQNKERSKKEVLSHILSGQEFPDLYGDLIHQITINYYPPRGDNKEGWDNIDLFGWLGYPMQLKLNFLCRDSILAAPVVLDSVLFLDWAQRQGDVGLQSWLGFYFKSPAVGSHQTPEHDLFKQWAILTKRLERIS